MKVIIAGSRDITDYETVHDAAVSSPFEFLEIISGGARGVDRLGEIFATEYNLPVTIFRAEWEKHGKKAGYLRNVQMAEYSDALIAVWDGVSKGTKHMINTMHSYGKPVYIYRV